MRVFHEKYRTSEGAVVELKVFRLPKSEEFPEGYKYSFFATYNGEVLVGYDNHHPKSHHRHLGKHEEPYTFRGLDRLREDFLNDFNDALKALRKGK